MQFIPQLPWRRQSGDARPGRANSSAAELPEGSARSETQHTASGSPFAPLPELLRSGVLRTFFQPIVAIRERRPTVRAVECLTRGLIGSRFESASTLFAGARDAELVFELDRACIESALRASQLLPASVDLFLNVQPVTLHADRTFPAFLTSALETMQVPASRIVLEAVEHVDETEPCRLPHCRSLGGLRAVGVRLALDDVRADFGGAKRVDEHVPEFLKVDMSVIRGSISDELDGTFLRDIRGVVRRRGTELIAKRVETNDDLAFAVASGFRLMQGFLVARPMPAPELLSCGLSFPS